MSQEPSKQTQKMKEMEDTINTLTNKLGKVQAELDESKCNLQVSAVQHQQAIDQMTVSTFNTTASVYT